MATSYEGPATLRTAAGDFPVQVHLSTSVGHTYSWEGRAVTTDVSAVTLQGRGGALRFDDLPGPPSGGVHIPVTELWAGGGVLLRVHGSGRAPYEVDGEIVTHKTDDGVTVYQRA